MLMISRFASATFTLLSTLLVINPVVSTQNRDLHTGTCHGELHYFQSEVYVDFNGFDTDTSDLTKIRWQSLEKAFRMSYNSLSEDLCDDSYRRIVDVSINPRSEDEVLIRRGGDEYSLSFTIEAVCRGCDPTSATLFSPPSPDYFRKLIASDGTTIESVDENLLSTVLQRRRAKGGKSEKKDKNSKESKSDKSDKSKGGDGKGKGGGSSGSDDGDSVDGRDDIFDCVCTSRNPRYRAPTEEEFGVVYGAAIRSVEEPHAQRHGGVFVDTVVMVTEIQVGSCSIVAEPFESLVAIELFGDYKAITDEERLRLENNFVWAYNGLQDHRCDSSVFRTATSADIFFMVDPAETDQSTFVYLMNVKATCRGEGCSNSDELLLFSDTEESTFRNLQFGDGAECSCPIWGTEFGPPSTPDTEGRYFQVIQELRFRGALPSIDASGYVKEIGSENPTKSPTPSNPTRAPVTESPTKEGDTRSPTTPPTLSPTLAPVTESPTKPGETRRPTQFPTRSPPTTESPTGPGETRRPTRKPISLPPFTLPPTENEDTLAPSEGPTVSAAPSNDPTDAPTAAPSASLAPSTVPSTSSAPSDIPSDTPSNAPTESAGPSTSPSGSPSLSSSPSGSPSGAPSISTAPSGSPSKSPSGSPSESPTASF